MPLNKDKLIFDEANPAESDQVGSHILGTAGAKVGSTDVGGKESLDVNVTNTLSVTSLSDFAEDSAHVSGDIGSHILAVRQDALASSVSADGDYGSLKLNALGELYVHDTDVNAELDSQTALLTTIDASLDAIEVDAAAIEAELILVNSELDSQTALLTTIDASLDAIEIDAAAIEAELILVNTELDSQTALLTTMDASLDAIEVDAAAIRAQTDQFTFNAGRLEVLADIRIESDVADDAPDTENPLKVGSRAVDGLLSAISASGDKANLVSDMYRRVYVNDAPNVGFNVEAASVTSTAAELVATSLLGRKRIMIQNLGNRAIFVGFDNTVTTANGLRISAGAFLEMPFGEDLDIWAITDSGTQNVRVVEIA